MSLFLGACAESTLVTGQPRNSIEVEDVVVYYFERPRCNFETIAHIEINGGYFSLTTMLAEMRQQAAEVGASGLYLLHTQQLDVTEYLGLAKANRCLSE